MKAVEKVPSRMTNMSGNTFSTPPTGCGGATFTKQ